LPMISLFAFCFWFISATTTDYTTTTTTTQPTTGKKERKKERKMGMGLYIHYQSIVFSEVVFVSLHSLNERMVGLIRSLLLCLEVVS